MDYVMDLHKNDLLGALALIRRYIEQGKHFSQMQVKIMLGQFNDGGQILIDQIMKLGIELPVKEPEISPEAEKAISDAICKV